MTDLSPAAQAVLDGFRAVPSLMDGPSIAGAIRAAADQVVPANVDYFKSLNVRRNLLAIANELENIDD